MTSTMEITESLQDGFLKALETGQRLTLEAFGAGISSLKGAMPTGEAMPWTESVVSPHDAITSSFRFAELLLESQKAFLGELVALVEPTTTSDSATKAGKG
jgi:hypothetical protein